MIELTVDAVGLARCRFAVSPLHEVVTTLLPRGARPGPDADSWAARARRTLRRARLPLLSELARDEGGYVPDFLSPHPPGPAPTVEEQLERIRCTPPERVLGQPASSARAVFGRLRVPRRGHSLAERGGAASQRPRAED